MTKSERLIRIGARIRDRREALGLSQEQLAFDMGYKSRSSINKMESGKNDIPQSMIVKLSERLNTTPAYLMGWDEEDSTAEPTKGITIPVLGQVAAGIPITAVEDILDYEEITQEMASQGEHIALRIKGDSMEPKISDGDVVIVRLQEDASTGDTVVALVNGEEATVKRLKKSANGIALIPTNPCYEPIYFDNEEIEQLPVRIVGKVVELRAKF